MAGFAGEERRELVEAFGVPEFDRPGEPMYWLNSLEALSVVPYDHDTWLAAARDLAALRAAREAEKRAEAEQQAAKEAQAAVRLRERLDRLEAMSDTELLQAASWDGRLYGDYYLDEVGTREDKARRSQLLLRLSRLRAELNAQVKQAADEQDAIRKAAEEAECERRREEREAWIAAHGSDYLKRAIAAGYNCQRRYVIERAAIEHPGAVVDCQDAAEWKSRSCPSEAALDLAERVKGQVVWLTQPPMAHKDESDEFFEACEAVAVRGFLGKHDVVYVL